MVNQSFISEEKEEEKLHPPLWIKIIQILSTEVYFFSFPSLYFFKCWIFIY